jgi:nucleotide-binding universal stress UspA family protein
MIRAGTLSLPMKPTRMKQVTKMSRRAASAAAGGDRIVCATDFSANAERAADVAAALAARAGATLVLVHVTDETNTHAANPEEFSNFARPALAQLKVEARRLRRAGVSVTEVLLNGYWAEQAMARFLAQDPPALVVVSSVSKIAFERWTLGSVSEGIAQSSPAPTLVVRDPAPLLEWARGETTLRVLAGTALGADGDAVLRWVAGVKRFGPCEITLGHINWPPHSRAEYGGSGPLLLARNPARLQRMLERDVLAKARAVAAEWEPRVRVLPSWGRPDAPLLSLARDLRSDLIVVGTHQRHGFNRIVHGSVSRDVLRHATASVVCVPVTDAAAPMPVVRTFRRILVATDFSVLGNAAIGCAFGAAAPAADVKIVHVIPPSTPTGPVLAGTKPGRVTRAQLRRWEADACRRMRALVPAAVAARAASVDCAVLQGSDAARMITQEAARFGADLICLGSHGRSLVAEAVVGSVARAVLVRSDRPVLVSRQPEA